MKASPAIASVVLAASLWGTTGTVAHLISGSVGPVTVGATTMGVGGLVLAGLAGRQAIAVWRHRDVRLELFWAALAVTVYPLAFYTGMNLAGVAAGNIIALGVGPLVGAALEWWLDRRRPGRAWWWALACGATGVVALSLSDRSLTTADSEYWPWGIVAALVAGVSYGGFSYLLARLMRSGHSALGATGAVFGLGAVVLIGVLIWSVPTVSVTTEAFVGLGYLVVGPMVVAYLFYGRALSGLASSSVLVIALVEPAVATVLAVVIVGERFGPWGIMGLVAIAAAVWLAGRPSPLQERADSP